MFTTPSVSFKNFKKLSRGLQYVVSTTVLDTALRQHQLTDLNNTRRVSLHSIRSCIEDLSTQTTDPVLMIRAYSKLNYRHEFLSQTFLSGARTLDDIVKMVKRYSQQETDLASVELFIKNNRVELYLLPHPDFSDSRQQLESMLYAILRILQAAGLQQPECFLPWSSAKHYSDYYTLFTTPVRFEREHNEYRLSFPVSELNKLLNWSSMQIERLASRERKLIRTNKDHQWSSSVQLLMPLLLRCNESSIEPCAYLLATSKRTLQRRLKEEGSPYALLLEQCRIKLTQEYLHAGYAYADIAKLIGYRQTAQFYRSFQQWFGQSPRAYISRNTLSKTPTETLHK